MRLADPLRGADDGDDAPPPEGLADGRETEPERKLLGLLGLPRLLGLADEREENEGDEVDPLRNADPVEGLERNDEPAEGTECDSATWGARWCSTIGGVE